MALTTKLNVRYDAVQTASRDTGAKTENATLAFLINLLDGTGLSQASKHYARAFTGIANSTNSDTDLSGALTDPFGVALNFTAIKGLIVRAADANPGNITVGNVTNGITSPFGAATHSQIVAPGGIYLNFNPSAAGFAITASTADLLRIATAATAGTYAFDLFVVGI